MDDINVIKKPLVTEKSTVAMNEENRYAFQVDLRATKDEIKRAVERLYNVKVEKVTTQVRKGKQRRTRFGYATEADTKTAVVRLNEKDTIELF
jgi:large subunit ribosomal protein L23